MGVISITQRSERLGNLGGTSAAHGVTSTDIGTLHHTTARTFAPTYYSRNYQEGNRAIGRGLGAAGDTMLRIGLAIQQREEDRKVDEYTNGVIETMERRGRDDRDITDWDAPDRKHLKGQKRGFYLRTGKGTMNVVNEWDTTFDDVFRETGDLVGANDRVRERTMKNLASYRRSTLSRLADHQASEYRRLELGNAQGTLTTQVNRFNNGDDAAIPEIFKQYDRVSQLQRLTPEQAKAGKEELALKLAASVVGRRVAGCQTAEDFDREEAAVKSGLKDSLPEEIAANLPGGERTVGGKMKDALLSDVRRARQSFEIQRDREEREALSELVAFSDNALARGGMDDLEAAHTDMAARAKKAPKGSRMETVARQQAKRLDMAADAEAKRLTWDDIIDHAGDKEPWTPPDGTRMSKFYGPLKEAYDRQRAAYDAEGALMADATEKEMFKANEAQLRAGLMELGEKSPGLIKAALAEASANGRITLDQYRKLSEEYDKVWSQNGMLTRGADLVKIMRDEFYFGPEYDPVKTMGVNAKTGKFGYLTDPETKKPYPGQDAEWEIEDEVKGEAPPLWLASFGIALGPLSPYAVGWMMPSAHDRTVWRKMTLTSNEQLDLLNWAIELARHDGEKTMVHPRTGEKLDKPVVIDAKAEFRMACREIATRKATETAQGRIDQLLKALRDTKQGFAEGEEAFVKSVTENEKTHAAAKQGMRAMKRKPFAPRMPNVDVPEE